MIELLELKFSLRWQTNKIRSDWSNSPRHSSSRQFRSPRDKVPEFENLAWRIYCDTHHEMQIVESCLAVAGGGGGRVLYQ